MKVEPAPNGGNPSIEGALRRADTAQRKMFEAKREVEDANKGLVEEVVRLGWFECVTPKAGMIRRRLRNF